MGLLAHRILTRLAMAVAVTVTRGSWLVPYLPLCPRQQAPTAGGGRRKPAAQMRFDAPG